MNHCYIAFGSNQNQPLKQLARARARLANHPLLKELRASSIYQSKAWGYQAQADFYNAVIHYQSKLSPQALLKLLHHIEHEQGRKRPFKNAPRTLDLDLIAYNKIICHTPKLTLPHPLYHQRSFVLAPFIEINPDYKDPRHGNIKKLFFDMPKSDLIQIIPWKL